ncbi:PrGVORF36 [Pieris rapae granulovirus Wuhan]|uniref:PrGVORF36 n=1 Tax=Pieris rapae granulovirus Wuhan TaxID=2848030 RepID=D2J4K3_9BBAC|nr:PrGVORF36 [Betabaculovirus arrapae]ACZ63522.1 PrGVORF36 [Betabaculovirus arrapae]AGS18799.1 hypothetical protein [Pieris rapae granulovirus]UOS85710.1 ORF36 [Pieris rapae granulovirus]
MSLSAMNLENAVQELYKNLEIHKLAIETLKRENELMRQEKLQLNKEWTKEKANWCQTEKQHQDVITTLAEQLRTMDNDIQNLNKIRQDFSESRKELLEQSKTFYNTKRELLEQTKKNKILKKKIKKLTSHINNCNEVLDNVICDGDMLLE